MRKAILTCVVLAACDVPPELDTTTQADFTPPSAGLWTPPTIAVCFDDPTPDNDKARDWIKEAVHERLEGITVVRFTGWGACNPYNQPGLHVGFSQTTGVSAFGNALDGVVGGTSIYIDSNDETQIKTDAVSVFTRALGFVQAIGYRDGSVPCPEAIGSTDLLEGCSWPGELKPRAVQTLQSYYGAVPGYAVDDEAKCLTAPAPGAPVQGERCRSEPGQIFPHAQSWAPPRTHTRFESLDNLCLEVFGFAVYGNPCSREPATWRPAVINGEYLGSGLLESYGGFTARYFISGSPVEDVFLSFAEIPWREPGADNVFHLDWPSWLGFSIMDRALTKCLRPDSHIEGAYVHMQSCSAEPYGINESKWVWQPGGALVHFVTQMCLTPAEPAEGASRLRIMTCDGSYVQRWNLRSQFAWEGNGDCPLSPGDCQSLTLYRYFP